MLSETAKISWVARYNLLLCSLKNEAFGTNQVLFWRKNFYYWCQNQSEKWLESIAHLQLRNLCVARTKFPANVLEMLCSVRVMSCHYISLKKGKLSQKKYLFTHSDGCNETVDGNCSIWKAMCFSAERCIDSYKSFDSKLALSDNVDMFWSKEFWSPNSPDLNLLDYYVSSNWKDHKQVSASQCDIIKDRY